MKNRGGGEPSERPLTLCPPIVILTLYEGFRNAVHGENKQTGRWVGVGSDTYTHTHRAGARLRGGRRIYCPADAFSF